MRRTLGAIALGLGALLLVVGLMAKPVLYTQLATVPLNYKSTSVSVGRDMSVLRLWSDDAKVGHYDKLTGVTVQSTRQVLGIPGRVPADKQSSTAFWQTGVKSIAVGVGDLSYSMETVSFDRLTGVANNCCGDQVSIGDLEKPDAMKNITHEGGYFKFPFDVQKQSYAWWDGDLGKATAAKFVRTEDLFGTETYVFEQRIDKQAVARRTVGNKSFEAFFERAAARQAMRDAANQLDNRLLQQRIFSSKEILMTSLEVGVSVEKAVKGAPEAIADFGMNLVENKVQDYVNSRHPAQHGSCEQKAS